MSNHEIFVKAGIKLLDAKSKKVSDCGVTDCRMHLTVPGVVPSNWRDSIKGAGNLDLSSTSSCVLGLVFGDYWKGTQALDLSDSDASLYGFSADTDFQGLTEEWKKQLGIKPEDVIKVGQVRTESDGGTYGAKVTGTVWITDESTEEDVLMYVLAYGRIKGGKFVGYAEDGSVRLSDYIVRTEKDAKQDYPHVLTPFKVEAGMFVTNDMNKVYYFDGFSYHEVSENKYSVVSINTKGLREVTLPSGKKFRDLVG